MNTFSQNLCVYAMRKKIQKKASPCVATGRCNRCETGGRMAAPRPSRQFQTNPDRPCNPGGMLGCQGFPDCRGVTVCTVSNVCVCECVVCVPGVCVRGVCRCINWIHDFNML